MSMINTAFVLGAGLGTRLRPLTATCPKPLLPIKGRPMVTYVFEQLALNGIKRFIINTHHAAECWLKVFPNSTWQGLPLIFRHEPELLGTAGGLKNIEDLIANETILLHSGDVVTNLPLAPLINKHVHGKAEVTLALRSNGTKTIGLDQQQLIRHVGKAAENTYAQLSWHDYANVAVISPVFLKRIPDNKPRDIASIWKTMTDDASLQGIVLNEGYWHNIGTIEEYEKFNSGH